MRRAMIARAEMDKSESHCSSNAGTTLDKSNEPVQPNASVFRTTGRRYEQILVSCLKGLLAE